MTNDTHFVLFLPICQAVYAVLHEVGDADVRISEIIARVLSAGTFAGSGLSDAAQRNLIRYAAEFMFTVPDRYPKRVEVNEGGEVIWPDLQPFLEAQARRIAGGAR